MNFDMVQIPICKEPSTFGYQKSNLPGTICNLTVHAVASFTVIRVEAFVGGTRER
jgi:hypothetical protein